MAKNDKFKLDDAPRKPVSFEDFFPVGTEVKTSLGPMRVMPAIERGSIVLMPLPQGNTKLRKLR